METRQCYAAMLNQDVSIFWGNMRDGSADHEPRFAWFILGNTRGKCYTARMDDPSTAKEIMDIVIALSTVALALFTGWLAFETRKMVAETHKLAAEAKESAN